MDSDISILHVVPPTKLKPQKSVVVHLSTKFNRRNLPVSDNLTRSRSRSSLKAYRVDVNSESVTCQPLNNNIEMLNCFIDRVWHKRTQENPKLYNATKFRVNSICTDNEDREKVLMCLGVTDYKEYLGTNWAHNVGELQTRGLALHNNSQAFLSDALGVGAFVLTIDKCLIFLRRSEFCAEAPCLWDIPGGHPEPKEIVGGIPLDQINVSEMQEESVLVEIFESIIREVTDEVNIPPSHLEEPLYMGTVRNKTSAGRPSSEFFIRCKLTSHEVKGLYDKGNQSEADESTNIKFVSLTDINQLAEDKIRKNSELWKNLAPSAKGCLILYWMSHQIV